MEESLLPPVGREEPCLRGGGASSVSGCRGVRTCPAAQPNSQPPTSSAAAHLHRSLAAAHDTHGFRTQVPEITHLCVSCSEVFCGFLVPIKLRLGIDIFLFYPGALQCGDSPHFQPHLASASPACAVPSSVPPSLPFPECSLLLLLSVDVLL